jgi:hypothetical protein
MDDQRHDDEGRIAAGSGSPSADTVEERARELALIEHPESPDVTDDDRRRARAELRGTDIPTSVEEPHAVRSASRDPGEPVAPISNVERVVQAEDPQKELEAAVIEGAREAEHDRMVESRREEARIQREESGGEEPPQR